MSPLEIEFPDMGIFSREWLDDHEEDAQALMSECKGRYPKCLCRTPGLPLYIAQRSRFYLARMPNSGPQHSPMCPAYEPDPQLSGWSAYSAAALENQGDGRLAVKLGVPLLIRGSGSGSTGTLGTHSASEKALRDRVELRGLLHLLWDRAELNRWTPRTQGRRHYRHAYTALAETADTITVRRQSLTRHFYMPEPFLPAQALEIEARRQKAFQERSRSASRLPLRILFCGQLRAIIEGDTEPGLRIGHMPNEFVIRLSASMLAKLRRETEFAWLDWAAPHPEFRIVLLLTMQRGTHGQWTADELTGMATTEEYVPVLSMEEALLAKRLCADGRHFYKPLPYDSPRLTISNFLLTDGGDFPIPLEIISGSGADAAARQGRIAQYTAEQQSYWVWDTHSNAVPPPLNPSPTSAVYRLENRAPVVQEPGAA